MKASTVYLWIVQKKPDTCISAKLCATPPGIYPTRRGGRPGNKANMNVCVYVNMHVHVYSRGYVPNNVQCSCTGTCVDFVSVQLLHCIVHVFVSHTCTCRWTKKLAE